MSTGGFNLRKWHSNTSSLMNYINALEDKVVSCCPDNQSGVIEEELSYAKESIAQESAPANKTQIKQIICAKCGTLIRICCYSISRN